MKIKDVLEFLNSISPFELQERWDNSGLNIGSIEDEIKEIVISLDIDSNLIDTSNKGVLFIVHHPLIFKGLSFLDFSKYPSNLIKNMILKDQKLIAMHTNFDKSHLNRYVFENILGLKADKEEDFIIESFKEFSFNELKELVVKAFNLKELRVVNKKEKLKGVALITGAGASLLDLVKAQAFLTGDIKYHDAIKAKEEDLMLIDIGHYESEKFFAEVLKNLLKPLEVSVIISQSQNPFEKICLKD